MQIQISKLSIIDTFERSEADQDSISFDLETAAASRGRVRYNVVVRGFQAPGRYFVVLYDEAGAIADMSSAFEITQEQLETLPDLNATVDIVGIRHVRGSVRCVAISDLSVRSPEPAPLAS